MDHLSFKNYHSLTRAFVAEFHSVHDSRKPLADVRARQAIECLAVHRSKNSGLFDALWPDLLSLLVDELPSSNEETLYARYYRVLRLDRDAQQRYNSIARRSSRATN
jgi:hypothetical protein